MQEERMVKIAYKWKAMLTRLLGKPKNRWEYDIINYMRKLKIKNWLRCTQDRNKWKLYVEKTITEEEEEEEEKVEEEEKKKKKKNQ
jgi:hypothetical protein